MLVVIKGAGDLATGIACRLFRCGFALVMTGNSTAHYRAVHGSLFTGGLPGKRSGGGHPGPPGRRS